jgi:hypothetical protein
MFEKLKNWLASSPQPKRRIIETHRIELTLSSDSGEPMSNEDAKALEHELEEVLKDAELNGRDPATTKAAIAEVARRHGAQLDEFDES